MMKPNVLIVDDEKHTREGLRSALEEHLEVSAAGDAAAATDPMTGEGIGQALLTGKLAGEAIASSNARDATSVRSASLAVRQRPPRPTK